MARLEGASAGPFQGGGRFLGRSQGDRIALLRSLARCELRLAANDVFTVHAEMITVHAAARKLIEPSGPSPRGMSLAHCETNPVVRPTAIRPRLPQPGDACPWRMRPSPGIGIAVPSTMDRSDQSRRPIDRRELSRMSTRTFGWIESLESVFPVVRGVRIVLWVGTARESVTIGNPCALSGSTATIRPNYRVRKPCAVVGNEAVRSDSTRRELCRVRSRGRPAKPARMARAGNPADIAGNGSGSGGGNRAKPPGSAGSDADGGNVDYVSLSQETRRRYLNYAISVITSRACPTSATGSSRSSDASCT